MNIWLVLHLLGVLLAIGNIATAAFWKIRADRSGNPAVIHHAARSVMLADYAFTLPGIVLIVLSGSVMAERAGIPLTGLNWLTLSLALFAVSGILWGAVLIPLQRRMIRLSAASAASGTISAASGTISAASGTISAAYRSASRAWAVFGTAATLLPLVILYLMVAKGF